MSVYPLNTRRASYAGSMLGYRLGRWPNIVPAWGQHIVFLLMHDISLNALSHPFLRVLGQIFETSEGIKYYFLVCDNT